MTRPIDADADAASRSRSVSTALLAELHFRDGVSRYWSGVGPFTWAGAEYVGTGTILSVSAIEETAELRATSTTLRLSGLPPEIRTLIAVGGWQNRLAVLSLVFFDRAGVVIGEPVRLRVHRMDTLTMQDGATVTVELTCESAFDGFDRPRIRRYTDADQQAEYPGDRAFEFVPSVQEFELSWGVASP
jgi:hypothetical protein